MRRTVWQAAIFSMLVLGLSITPGAVNGAPPAKTNPAKSSNNGNNSNNGELLTALHQAKTLLDTAIHDYDGHRAKAVGEIHHAIHELSPHTGAHKGGKGNTAAAKVEKANNTTQTTTPGETQAQSDMQLKQALQIISGLQVPNNHTKAVEHLKVAVTELNTALKIK